MSTTIDKKLEEMAAGADHFKHEPDDARKQGQALVATLLRTRKQLWAEVDKDIYFQDHIEDCKRGPSCFVPLCAALDATELEKLLR